mmetsp:Transcript_67066/g.193820  ORF Transcript_67066/g.193820 Transcript_67066/m.193820 type:complete len:404 (+) Transcript_67066:1061-2272(+)
MTPSKLAERSPKNEELQPRSNALPQMASRPSILLQSSTTVCDGTASACAFPSFGTRDCRLGPRANAEPATATPLAAVLAVRWTSPRSRSKASLMREDNSPSAASRVCATCSNASSRRSITAGGPDAAHCKDRSISSTRRCTSSWLAALACTCSAKRAFSAFHKHKGNSCSASARCEVKRTIRLSNSSTRSCTCSVNLAFSDRQMLNGSGCSASDSARCAVKTTMRRSSSPTRSSIAPLIALISSAMRALSDRQTLNCSSPCSSPRCVAKATMRCSRSLKRTSTALLMACICSASWALSARQTLNGSSCASAPRWAVKTTRRCSSRSTRSFISSARRAVSVRNMSCSGSARCAVKTTKRCSSCSTRSFISSARRAVSVRHMFSSGSALCSVKTTKRRSSSSTRS